MKKILKNIRDLELIESELKKSEAGVLALHSGDDSIIQFACNFIYLDKNVYAFILLDEELVDKIKFGVQSSFTILKNEKVKKDGDLDFIPKYKLFYISVSGKIREAEEKKTIDEVMTLYRKKYSDDGKNEKINSSTFGKLVCLDSEEIQAFEETGN